MATIQRESLFCRCGAGAGNWQLKRIENLIKPQGIRMIRYDERRREERLVSAPGAGCTKLFAAP